MVVGCGGAAVTGRRCVPVCGCVAVAVWLVLECVVWGAGCAAASVEDGCVRAEEGGCELAPSCGGVESACSPEAHSGGDGRRVAATASHGPWRAMRRRAL